MNPFFLRVYFWTDFEQKVNMHVHCVAVFSLELSAETEALSEFITEVKEACVERTGNRCVKLSSGHHCQSCDILALEEAAK